MGEKNSLESRVWSLKSASVTGLTDDQLNFSQRTPDPRLSTPDSLWLRRIFYVSMLTSGPREVVSVRIVAARSFLLIAPFTKALLTQTRCFRFGSANVVVTRRCRSVQSRRAKRSINNKG
jgi:hypothetical protein